MDGVGAGLHRGHPPDDVLGRPGSSGPNEKVSVCAASAPADGASSRSPTSSPGRPASGSPPRGSRPGGSGRRGRAGRSGWRTSRRPSRRRCKIVTARSGICLVAGVLDLELRSLVLASRWAVGNLAAVTSTGKSPEGSFASWRWFARRRSRRRPARWSPARRPRRRDRRSCGQRSAGGRLWRSPPPKRREHTTASGLASRSVFGRSASPRSERGSTVGGGGPPDHQ